MEIIGWVLLCIVTAAWIFFIGFILFAIGGLIYFALEEFFDEIVDSFGGSFSNRRPLKDRELVLRYRTKFSIWWLIRSTKRRLRRMR